MQLLRFQIGERAMAIRARDVDGLFPVPELEGLPGAPGYLAGLMRHQGKLVPVIDLLQLVHGGACPGFYSTRIILVSPAAGSSLGLMVERATDMIAVEDSDPLKPLLSSGIEKWLEPVRYEYQGEPVYVVNWKTLLTPELARLAEQTG